MCIRDRGEEELRRIDQDAATTMDIMREVIEMLTAQQTRENRAETQAEMCIRDRVNVGSPSFT